MDVYRCRYLAGRVRLNGPVDHRWISLEDIDRESACMPCGQGAGTISDVASCREIVEGVIRQARETIERLGALA